MSTAATSLANLLNLLDLPRRLHFVNSGSQTPSDLSQNALNTIGGPVRITPDTSLLPSLHPLLYQYARDWPIPDTALPRLQSLLYGLSELAQSWADPLKRISGEVGVQSFIATFLAESVNKFLSETAFASAGCRLYWRIVGLGKSGRPDLELVLSWMDDRGQVIEKILAVIEVKTTYSMSPSHATNIRQATDAGIIIDQRGEVRVAQAQRLLDGPKRIIQQVSTHLRRHPLLPFSARFRC